MSEDEVSQLLGAPSKDEKFQIDDDLYDVWFYEVVSQKKNQAAETVPLTFKNGQLAGITTHYYETIRKSAAPDQINGYDKGAERMREDESEQNFNFW